MWSGLQPESKTESFIFCLCKIGGWIHDLWHYFQDYLEPSFLFKWSTWSRTLRDEVSDGLSVAGGMFFILVLLYVMELVLQAQVFWLIFPSCFSFATWASSVSLMWLILKAANNMWGIWPRGRNLIEFRFIEGSLTGEKVVFILANKLERLSNPGKYVFAWLENSENYNKIWMKKLAFEF